MKAGIFVRNLAKYSSFLSISILILVFWEKGIMPWRMEHDQLVLFMFFPFGVIAGMFMSMKWEGLGGLLTLTCLFLFYVFFEVQNGIYPQQTSYIIFSSPGVLYVLSALLNDPVF